MDFHGNESYQDILILDPVLGFPFPPEFKGFDRAESEQVWRVFQGSMRRVEEISAFHASWPSIPKTMSLGFEPLIAGSVIGSVPDPVGPSVGPPQMSSPMPFRGSSMDEMLRAFGVSVPPVDPTPTLGEPSRRVGEGSLSRDPTTHGEPSRGEPSCPVGDGSRSRGPSTQR